MTRKLATISDHRPNPRHGVEETHINTNSHTITQNSIKVKQPANDPFGLQHHIKLICRVGDTVTPPHTHTPECTQMHDSHIYQRLSFTRLVMDVNTATPLNAKRVHLVLNFTYS